MIYRVAMLSTILLAGMGSIIPAYAEVSNVQVVDGTCSSSSNTAEGPLGSDLAKRESRFYCDTAAITFFDDYEGHVLIKFLTEGIPPFSDPWLCWPDRDSPA